MSLLAPRNLQKPLQKINSHNPVENFDADTFLFSIFSVDRIISSRPRLGGRMKHTNIKLYFRHFRKSFIAQLQK